MVGSMLFIALVFCVLYCVLFGQCCHVSLECTFLIARLVFSNVYFTQLTLH
jgi:uncharacterized MAPEG superfamily protein